MQKYMSKETYHKKLGDQTMRHIYGIWFVRKVLPSLALEAGALAVFAIGMQWSVKWGHLVNNLIYRWTHHPIAKMDDFWLEALRNTELMTKLLVIAAITASVFLVRDALRAARNFFVPYRVSI